MVIIMSEHRNVQEQLEAIRQEVKALNIQLDSVRELLEKKRIGEIKRSSMFFFMGIVVSLFLGLLSNFFVSFVMFVVQNPTHGATPFILGMLIPLVGLLAWMFVRTWRDIKEFAI